MIVSLFIGFPVPTESIQLQINANNNNNVRILFSKLNFYKGCFYEFVDLIAREKWV